MPKITLTAGAFRAVRLWIMTTLVALAGVLGWAAPVQAQVSSYGYSVSFGSYVSLRSGTPIIPNSGGGSLNDGYSTPIVLPFTFDYGGVQVDKVTLSTNGYLALGTHRITNNYNILKGASNNLIGFANTDLTTDIAGGQYSYLVGGTTPNRIFVLQARDFQLSDNTPAKTGNAQIWLYETTNVIEIRYGAFGTGWGTGVASVSADSVRVGLRGVRSNDLAAVTGTWASSSIANNPRVGMPLLGRTFLPTPGQVLRFAPTCNVPTPVITTNSPVCEGNTLTLSTTGFAPTASYAWTGPNGFTASSASISIPAATPADAGLYSVIVTVGGCQSGRGNSFASVNPTFSSDPDFQSRCGPGSVTFTANGPPQVVGYSFRWYTQAQGGSPIPGASTNTFTTPSLSADAIYYVTVVMPTSAGGCEGPRVPMTASIRPIPAASLIPVGSTTLCAGDTVVLRAFPRGVSSARNLRGNFSAYGYTYFLDGQPLSEFGDSIFATVGGTYTVQVTDFGSECSATSGPVVVTVAAPVSAAFDYSARLYCQNSVPAPVPTISGSSGGTFSVSPTTGLVVNPTTGRLTLATATPGQYQITYSVGGTCPASATRSVFVLAAPIATFSYQPTGPVCAGGQGILPAVLAPGATAGFFSASPSTGLALNSQNGAIFLGNSQPGTYIVTNTIGAGNVCPQVTATTSITIGTTPTAGISAGGPLSFCQGGSVTLTATGGGPNATFAWSNGATSPSIVATTGGSYTVTITNATGCAATSPSTTVTVFPQTTAGFTYPSASFCQTTTASTLPTITGTQGGTFSATPTGLSLNAQTGQITPSISALGTYTVTYSVNSRTCPSSSSQTVTIQPAPTAVFGYTGPGPFCAGAGGTLAPAMAPGAVKGTFSVSPTGLTVDPQSGVITLSSSQAGTYVISNSVAPANGCGSAFDTAEVTITPRPAANVSANGPTTFCVGGSVTLSVAAFSGSQFLWNTGATSQSIVVSTTGSYTVTVTNRQGCSTTSAPTTVTVNPLASATFSYGGATFCAGGAPNPTPTITGTPGGTFSAAPTGLSINPQTGQIDLSASQAGGYRVTYSVGGNCPANSTVSVTLTSPPSAAFFYSPDLSPCAGGSIVVSPIADDGAELGTFSATPTGLTLDAQTGAINLATSQAGTYTVTNTLAAANGCPAVTATTTFVVEPTPNAGISANGPTSFCAGGSVTLTATGGDSDATFVWSNGATSSSITVTTGGSFSVVITNGSGCSDASAATVVTILSPPSAAFTYSSSTFCLTGTNPAPNITGASGGTFTSLPSGLSLNAQTGVINLGASQPGSYRVTYTVGGNCPAATTQSITITTAPLATFTYPLDGKRCAGGVGQLTPLFGQGASAGTFSASPTGLSLNPQSGIIDLGASSAGLYTVTNTIAAANGCAASTATASVLIEPTPNAGISAGGPLTFCQGSSVTLTATGGGPNATFAWSTGATTSSITVSTSATVTVTVTNAAGCGKSSAPTVVTVNPQPSALFVYRAASFCLTGTNPSPTISGSTGGTFSATPTGLAVNAQSGVINLSASQPGVYTVTYSIGGVCPASHSVSVTITNAPIATFSYPTTGPTCAGATGSLAPALANGATAGTFSATPSGLDLNAATGVISLAGSAPGTYSVTNAVAAANGCAATSATTSVVINALPQASIAHDGPLAFCAGGSVTLTANGGATYLWNTGATTPSITVTQSGTFSVTATNAAGCSNTSANITVTVNPQATATFAFGSSTYCLGGTPNPTPSITGTSGGTFTASPTGLAINAQTGQVNLSNSQAGIYRITYSVGGNCPASSTQTVTLNAAPSAAFFYSPDLSPCAGGSIVVSPIADDNSELGTFSATPSGLTIDPQTGAINLATSQAGTYIVTNTLVAANGCPAVTATTTFVVEPTPNAGISASGSTSFCAGGSVTLTATGGGANATFAWSTGATTASITVTTGGPYSVVVTNGAGCSDASATTTVTVTPQASAAFTYGGRSFCRSGQNPTANITGTSGGTFSATPSGLTLNAQTGAIDLAASQPGTYTVTYAVGGTCPASSTQTISITPAPLAGFSYPTNGPTCAGATGSLTPVLANGAVAGTFSATPSGLALNAQTGVINLATSQPGTYSVTNALAASNGCAATSATASVVINAAPTASISANGPLTFCAGGSVTLTASGGQNAQFLWSNGATTANITVTQSGPYSVTVTSAAGCSATSQATTVTVNPQPSAAFAYAGSTFCLTGTDPVPTVSGTSGGTFSASPSGLSLNGQTGAINLAASQPGTFVVTYAVSGNCPASQTQTVTITGAPLATFTYPSPTSGNTPRCAGTVGTVVPTFSSGASAGTFSATPSGLTINPNSGVINLATSQPGTYVVTNAIAAGNGCAAASATASITINALPTASISVSGPTTFCAGGSVTLTAGTASSYLWSTGATSQAITVTTSAQVTVTVTNASGCAATSAPITVTVTPQASAAFAYGASSFCVSGSVDPTPTISGTTGGTFSASPAGLTLDAQTGTVLLAAATPGTYTVTYAVAGTCGAQESQQIVIQGAPLAGFAYSSNGGNGGNCAGTSGTITPTFSSGASAGSFSATPSGLSLNATSGVINLATSQPGTYTVTNAIAAGNGCAAASTTANVVINAAPTASILAGGPLTFCQGGSVTLTASGGTSYAWNTGATTASITVMQSGTFSVTATNAAGCSATSATTTVTVTPQASAAFAYATSTFCGSGSNPVPTVNGSTGGTFSASPSGLSLNGQTGEINLAGSAVGTYTVTYAVSGNCPASATQTVTITTAPSASFSYSGTGGNGGNCAGTSGTLTPTFGNGASAGAFSATPLGLTINATSGVVNLATSQPGTYSVTNAIAAGNGCAAASATATIVINAAPTASISADGPLTFCQSGSVTLTASGGTSYVWSNGATSASITVTQSGTFSVTATNAAGCSATSATTTVTVTPQASAAFGYATSTFCASGSNPVATVTGSTGGTFSALPSGLSLNAQTGEINLAASQTGTYAVTYAVGGNCPAAFTQTVTITTAPSASFSYSGTGGNGGNCAGTSGTLTPTFSSGASAGSFSATPSGLSLNAQTGVINLASSQPGTYTVTNAIAAGNGCAAASATTTVVINAAPTASISAGGPTTFCQGGSVTLTASGGTSYEWSNGATSANISVTQSGTFSVTVTNAAGCSATSATTTVTVTSQASAGFAYATSTFCASGSNPVPTVSGSTGGTFSALPAGLSLNGQTGEINLAASQTGTYTVTYAVSGNCPAASTQMVTITTAPSASFTYSGTGGNGGNCAGTSGTLTPTFSSGASAGSFSATPSGLSLNAQTGVINLASSQPGTYTVTNAIAAGNGCAAASTTANVVIKAAPTASILAGGPLTFCQGGSVTLTASGGTSYVWSNGATSASITVTQSGTFSVTATNAVGCSATSATTTVTVNPQASAAFAYTTSTFCGSGSNPVPTVTGSTGGTFSASPSGLSLNAQTGEINLAGSAVGTYSVTYQVSGTCPASSTQTVTISTAPSASIAYSGTGGNSGNCAGTSGTLTPTFSNGASAGAFSATPAGLSLNAQTGVINLATSQPGTYSVTNAIAAGNGCAAASATTTVVINAAPTASISAGGPITFCQGGSVTLTASGGTSYEWSNGAATASITVTQSGTFSVTATNAAGCSATSATTSVTVNPQASAAFAYSTSTFCTSSSNPTPNITGTTGGLFTSSPSGLSLDGQTGEISLVSSAVGTYVVTYAVSGTCPASSTQTVTITTAPLASFSYVGNGGSGNFCLGSNVNVAPALAPGASAGSFFASPPGLAINRQTGELILNASALGTYTVTNTLPATGGCAAVTASFTVVINPLPTATITADGPLTFCQGGSVTLTASGGTSYVWSNGATSPSITVTQSGQFSVVATNAAGCSNTSAVRTVTVTPQALAAFAYPTSTFCVSGPNPTPTLTGTLGGLFTAVPSGLGLNPQSGTITLVASRPGTYTVTYFVGGVCSDAQTQVVTISAAPQGTFAYPSTIGCAGTPGTLTPVLTPGSSVGVFSVTPAGLSINATTGVVSLAATAPGTYVIRNTISAAGGCSAVVATTTMTIIALPTVAITNLGLTYCSLHGPVTLTGTVNGQAAPGVFTIDGQPARVFDPGTLGAGPHVVAFTGTVGGACDATVSTTVTVIASPTQPVITVQTLPSGLVQLTSSQPTGNQWYLNGSPIPGATGPTYTASAATQNGSYTVICTVAGCPSSPSAPVLVQITGLVEGPGAPIHVALYPVPTLDGYVTLEAPFTGRKADVTVYDIAGRCVWRTTLTNGNGSSSSASATGATRHALDLRDLPVGTYLLRLTTDDGTATRRLVRE